MNIFRTVFLMMLMTILLVAIGMLVGGRSGMVIAFLFAAVMNFVSYWFSDKIVLAMYRAKPLEESQMPWLFEGVRKLTQNAGIPMPKLYIVENPMPNAFATGRNPQNASVAVTNSIVEMLTKDELLGVLAHELSHVKNRDILIGSIAATLAGAIFMLARFAQWGAMFGGNNRQSGNFRLIMLLFVGIIAPIAAMLIQAAVSRSREFEADATGARISHKPLALASALRKISAPAARYGENINPTTAHMFIVSPFNSRTLMSLFSTHPPVEKRIEHLETIKLDEI
ncbi:MAG: zinc metalloprotease HtpX [Endomicrobiales bacterium]|nr:zinc metalloprotease HtpX [Endomicrobiales bacterium]